MKLEIKVTVEAETGKVEYTCDPMPYITRLGLLQTAISMMTVEMAEAMARPKLEIPTIFDVSKVNGEPQG